MILILGAGGLIGHALFRSLGERFGAVQCTLHGTARHSLFARSGVHESVDVRDSAAVRGLLARLKPDVVLNCVGITKRKPEIDDLEQVIAVNSLFPHQLARWAKEDGFRVIHFSTDCVFDGALGNYTEESETSARDVYGRTKALGELRYSHTLTIRSSFIGRELEGKSELLEWALSMRGQRVKGFERAWYSGVSTREMARVVGDIVENHPDLGGLVQLATERPVPKCDLLRMIDIAFELGFELEPDSAFETRPTLDGRKLRETMNLELPDWPAMLAELAAQRIYDDVAESPSGTASSSTSRRRN